MAANNDPKDKKEKKDAGGYHSRKIIRNKKTGKLEEGEVTITAQEIYADDKKRAQAAKPNDGTYSGTAAPRVGGVKVVSSGQSRGGTKSQVKSSKRKIKRSSMSSKQKKSALKALDS